MLHCFSRLGPFYVIGRTDYNEMVQHIMKTTTTTRDQTTPADENANNHIELEKTIDSITKGASSILSLLSKSLPMPAQNAQVLCKSISFERVEQNLKQRTILNHTQNPCFVYLILFFSRRPHRSLSLSS